MNELKRSEGFHIVPQPLESLFIENVVNWYMYILTQSQSFASMCSVADLTNFSSERFMERIGYFHMFGYPEAYENETLTEDTGLYEVMEMEYDEEKFFLDVDRVAQMHRLVIYHDIKEEFLNYPTKEVW